MGMTDRKTIIFRLNESEHASLRKRANKKGRTMQGYIQELIEKDAAEQSDKPVLRKKK